MKMESGSEVKMPVAAEEAERAIVLNGEDVEINFPHGVELIVDGSTTDISAEIVAEFWQRNLAELIADIQRRTILAAAAELFNVAVLRTEWGSDVEWGYRKATEELERLAASLGEPGK